MKDVLIWVFSLSVLALLFGAQPIWDYFRNHFINAAAAARDPEFDGAGRVRPAGPPGFGPAEASGVPPAGAVARWWFNLEGWQQAAIIGGLLGLLAVLAVQRFADHDGIQRGDLLRALWLWSFILWFTLTIWTRAHFARRYPDAARWGSARANPVGCLGLFGAFEIFPESVWFLVTSLIRLVAWPLRSLVRR